MLNMMLRKTAKEEEKNWDNSYLIFYLLIGPGIYRFSPFELLYGRQVKDILRETWEENSKGNESMVSCVINMREKMEKMTELVQQSLTKAQEEQKRWYDRNVRVRELKKGDLVLVLLPTSHSKLLA